MRLRRWYAIAGLVASLALGFFFVRSAGFGPERNVQPFAAEIAALERARAHAEPGSAQAFKLQQKIDRIRAFRDGKPQFDNPSEFARILAEMKIPAGRTLPEYEPGYQRHELQLARATRARRATINETLPWVERGPGNVAGRARDIVVDPDDPTDMTWFIGTVGGGVWKTTDGGTTWQWLTPDFPVLSTSTIVMAPSNHDVLYVGTGESYYSVDVINGDGILKSTDRGVTWSHLASTAGNPAFNNVARLLVHPTNPDIVLAATTRGRYKEYLTPRSSIFKSTDGGANWTEVFASTTIGTLGRVQKVLQLIADPTDFNILYATVDEAGILKSTNAGNTWSYINTGITDFTGRFELAISPVNHLYLYAAAEGASHSELWKSTNGGTSWSHTTPSGSEPNWLGAQGWYDNAIVCHPTDVNTVYVGGIRLWKLTLSGTVRTATQLDAPVHVDHHMLKVIDAPGGWRLLDTSDGGVAVSTSTDAGWEQVTDGMVTTQFYGLDKRPGASAYVGGTQDNGTWLSPLDPFALTPWADVIGGDGYETSWHFDDPLKIIGGYQYNGLQRSLDGGQTWAPAITAVSPAGVIDNGGGYAPFITKIAKSLAAPDFLCAVGVQGVWRSSDFGGTWSLCAIPAGTWGSISSFHDICISRADPDVVWAGSRMDSGGQIHRSTNGAVSFTAIPNYATMTMGGISGMATHPTDANTAYVLFSFAARPKILRTTDGGANWTDITGFVGGAPSTNGFPDVAVYDLVVFSNNTQRMWAATEIGIVETLDGGATWALADNGLPNVPVWYLSEVEDEIIAGTHGRGVWSVTMPELLTGKTYNPLIDQIYQDPTGALIAELNLRSAYDSSQVVVNSVVFTTLGPNTIRQAETVAIPVLGAGTKTVVVQSYEGGTQYNSVVKSVDVFAPQEPVYTYLSDFETPNSDFFGSQFRIGTESGFTGSAIHSPHPYSDGYTLVHLLTVPIRVVRNNAFIEFDEIALVEPGDPGTVFGDSNFWDYVIVEGSQDGLTWTPIAPGYDAREYPEWEAIFYGPSPDSALLRHRTLNLRDVFAANDTVLIRFRLFADSSVNGWGWIIDNLEIQPDAATAVEGEPGLGLALAQNAPNPLLTQTSIRFVLPQPGPVSLCVFDVRGRLVRRLADGQHGAGVHTVNWDGRDGRGAQSASGVYFYRLVTPAKTLQRKMLVVR